MKCTHNYEGWDALARYDYNRDKALQYKEVLEAVFDQDRRGRQVQAFKEADVDQDGFITREEFSEFFEQRGQPVS